VPGMLFGDKSSFGSGQGLHVSLSPFDMHATLIACGPDFHTGKTSELPSGNVDIAPTILHVLGIKQLKKMDGRVLNEALRTSNAPLPEKKTHRIEASCSNNGKTWHQYLQISEVNAVQYFDEGNGGPGAGGNSQK